MAEPKTLYYPAWISSSGRVSLRWGKPCDTAPQAAFAGREIARRGEATLAFVVRFSGGEKTPLATYVYPPSARRIVQHWESLWDATEPEHPTE